MVKKSIRVLIVEDNAATACLLKIAFLAKSGMVDWDLCFAKDGEEALDCVFKRGVYVDTILPDLILLDWNLPKVHGQEVLQQLKSTKELQTVPVLVFSTSEEDVDVHAAYSSHANGYISKPVDIDAFDSVIDNIERFWVHTVRLPPKGNNRSR